MKKIITALALVATIGIAFTATDASAWGRGNGYCGNGGNGMGYGMMQGNAPVDNAAYQKFLDETVDLRTALAGDRAELRAVMAGTNPDPARARALTENIIEKQTKLSAAARENNIAPMGAGFGRGQYCDGTGPRNGKGRNW